MSTWPWIALYAITFVTGTERCELKMLDVRRGNIPAIAMSQDGEVLLAEAGQGGYPVAAVFQGDRRSTWDIRGLNSPRLVGIDGSGTILGSYQAQVKSGRMMRTFLLREGRIRLIPFPQEPELENIGFEPAKIGSDGEVFGSYTGTSQTPEFLTLHKFNFFLASAAALWNGDLKVLDYDESYGWMLSAVARTRKGILGHVPRFMEPRDIGKSVLVGHLPVLFAEDDRHETPSYLPLPKGFVHATPVFANPAGSLMLAIGSGPAGHMTSVIWWHDQPLVPKVPEGVLSPVLVSGTNDAKLAVGSIKVKRTQMAAIWESDKGIRSLEEYAREQGVLLPHGWRLVDAVGISPDGKRVYGNAINQNRLVRPYLLWLEKRPRKASE